MTRTLRPGLLAALLLALTFGAASATATPMPATGGTSVYFSSAGALTDLGLDIEVIGLGTNATLEPTPFLPSPTATFAVTAVDLSTVQIFHDGSGLKLSAGMAFVSLENFVINGGVPSITADVSTSAGAVGAVDVFELRDCRTLAGFCVGTDGTTTVDGLGLFLTQTVVLGHGGQATSRRTVDGTLQIDFVLGH